MVSQAQTILIAESIPHLVWVTGPDGRPRYINRRCQAYTGLSVEAAGAGDWQRLVHPDDLRPVQQEWLKAQQTGEFRAEYRLRRADGAYRWHRALGLAL